VVTKRPGQRSVCWDPAYRIIAARYPAVDIWAGLARDLWGRLDQVEALTNPRLALPGQDAGPATLQWPFSNPRPGRFSTDTLGAFYAALSESTAIAETTHHQAIRCREDRLEPHAFDMRVLAATIKGRFHDLRGAKAEAFPGILDPGSHAASQALALELSSLGSQGILFPSVRDAVHGPCVAAFTPEVVTACHHLRYLTYQWTGATVQVLFEKRPYPAQPG